MAAHLHETAFADEFPALAASLVGQFRVERELGRGGMGVVYLAREERLDRMVALKVLPAHLATQPATRERFLREALTAARLAHPNVVPVYRADEAGGTAFFAMAFVDGESLADRLRDRGALPPSDAVPILRDVAWALAYAHARGVVHRDVKPENILLERATGRTLVSDFGIAHNTAHTDPAARLTQDGYVLGTVHYMSPEQVNGQVLDGRSDLYALGVVAYQLLSGRLPFEGLALPALLMAHASRPAPPLRDAAPTVPASLAAVVDRCLVKSPDSRYPTGEALADALEAALAEAPERVRTTGPALPPGLPERLDEIQAAAIWRRAAQLQADALQRIEARDGLQRGARLAAAERAADTSAVGDASDASSADNAGYRVADVAGAAEEAGISRQYVALALAELPRNTLPSTAAAAMGVSERQATALLGTAVRSIGVTVLVPAPPGRALRALGLVLQQLPYDLALRATVGSHPLDGGVIVFDLPGPIVGASGARASAVNMYWMGMHQQLQASQVQVTLRAVPGSSRGTAEETEVTMTADLRPGVRGNLRMTKLTAGTIGTGSTLVVGGAIGTGLGAALTAAVFWPAIVVGAVAAGITLLAYRRSYPGVLIKAEGEMRRALEAVAGAVRSEMVFGTMPSAGRAQHAPTSSESDADKARASAIPR